MLEELATAISRHDRRTEFEICISDNGSTDDTPDVINGCLKRFADLSIRHVRQTNNLGFARNFEAVARLATGAGFIILADDDRLFPTTLGSLLQGVEQLSTETPLVIFNSLMGGDAIVRDYRLPMIETSVGGPHELLTRLGIFHASFVSNVMFHRETALSRLSPDMVQSRYPHMALSLACLVDGSAKFLPVHLVQLDLPADTGEQPMLTSVDMARLQTEYALGDPRCRRLVGHVYSFLLRMLPTAIYLKRMGRCPGNVNNPYADLRLSNVRQCYRRSWFWKSTATMIWLAATLTPRFLLGSMLRLVSRHPR